MTNRAMKFPDADLKFTANILASVVRAINVRRAIQAVPARLASNFWRVIESHLFDDAIVKWCIIFGSDDENRQPLHWKRMVDDEDRFRETLLAAIGKTQDEWHTYATEMRDYRNHLAAHQELNPKPERFPNMEPALTSCFHYYEYLRQKMRERGIRYHLLSLQEEAESERPLFYRSAEVAINATNAAGL